MECQVEKLEHFRHILLFEFNRGAKAAEGAGTLAPYMGTMPSERPRQENSFLVLRRIVLTLVTFHVQEEPSRFDEDCLNTLIHNDPRQCTRKLANMMNWDHSTIVRHLQSMGKVKKIGCKGTACSKPKVHRCGPGSSMRACHAAGPGSIPGRDRFPG